MLRHIKERELISRQRRAFSSEIGGGANFSNLKNSIIIGTMIRGGGNFEGAKKYLIN